MELFMDSEASTITLLERMLDCEHIQPTDLPLPVLVKITNCFSDDLLIGHGGFAMVYKGYLGSDKMVAVKKLSNRIDMDETKYNQEVDCLMKVRHTNIVRFLGYCANTHLKRTEFEGKFVMADVRYRLLCFEYLSNGNLRNFISDASRGHDWKQRYNIMWGICKGLTYLHDNRIVHLDLKPENILLNEGMVPKISDFGLSRCLDEDQTRAMLTELLGSTGYMAPEFFAKVITPKSDIYSLGVIFTEILTGRKGYFKQENIVECWRKRLEGSSTESAETTKTLLEQVRICAEISIDCMDLDPTKRPDARSIIQKLARTGRTNRDLTRSDLSTTSLVAQPSRIPWGELPAPSFNVGTILEDKSSTRCLARISIARANCTRAVYVAVMKIDTVLTDHTAMAVVEKLHIEALDLEIKIRNIRGRLILMANMSQVNKNGDGWSEEVRNLAYNVEDSMDKYFYYSFKMKDEWFLKNIITGSQYAHVFSEIADELVQVDMEIERLERRNHIWQPSDLYGLDVVIEERKMSQFSFQELVTDKDLVGIEDNRKMLTEWLYYDKLGSTVITVSGMGGLGKTALVADVYSREMINFPSHAWISVSQTYNVDALLRKLLREVGCMEHLSAPIEKMDVYELKVEIRRRIKDRKCLIVLDDVWSKDVYFQLCDGFQNSMQGIRIIITTRKNHVTALAPATRRLHLKPLSDTHASSLLCRISLHDNECPKELERYTTSILSKCQGLPSAIVSVGRLLSSGPHTPDFWSRMCYYDWNKLLDTSTMRAIFYPSYYDLSEDLKNCFLYCSLFPEDKQISCESLIRMWVAEGFVLSRGYQTPEEVAEGNLMELIDCNLLVIMQSDDRGRVVTCNMHGIVRDMAYAVAEKERFHLMKDYYSMSRIDRDIVRCLSLCKWYDKRIERFRFPHLRTLMSHETISSSAEMLLSVFSKSIYLTVLELQDSEVTEIPESLGTLFNLRYIGLRRTKVKSLPDSLVKLSNLQTLDTKETKIQNLPRHIGNVKKLRHLLADRYAEKNQDNFPCIFGVEPPPKHLLNSSQSPYIFGMQPPNDLSNLAYLETLETVQSTTGLPDQLKKLRRLRSVWIDNINTKDCENLFAALSDLPLLSSLLVSTRDEKEKLCIRKLNPVKLRRLITIGKLNSFEWYWEFPLGEYLSHLALSWCDLGFDPLNMLARQFPRLTYLQLSNVYGAETLDVTTRSFPDLKTLVLEYMHDVHNMVFRYEALPSIEALYIMSLTKLDKVPHGLESLKSLKKLWLLNLHTNFKAHWHKNEMHNKMQHVKEIQI